MCVSSGILSESWRDSEVHRGGAASWHSLHHLAALESLWEGSKV